MSGDKWGITLGGWGGGGGGGVGGGGGGGGGVGALFDNVLFHYIIRA